MDDIYAGDLTILNLIEAHELMGDLEQWERDHPEE